MDENFIKRLDTYMEYTQLNDNQLTVKAGITIGLINSARKRGKYLSGENIGKILYCCKDLNARWLLTGEGEMLIYDPIESNQKIIEALNILKSKYEELSEKYENAMIRLGRCKERLDKYEPEVKINNAV